MKPILILDDWYDADTGRYMVVIRSPAGYRKRLSFWNVHAARSALARLLRPR